MRSFLRGLNRFLFYLLVVFVVVYSVFPFYWAVVSSFKPSGELFSTDPSLLPVPFTLEHYQNVFLRANFGRNLLNSLIVAGGATLLSLTLGVMAAYALGRLPFPPKNAVLYIVLAMTMFPQISVLGGLFMLLRQTGLFNTHLGLILSYLLFTLPFTV
jgi:trehalose/maltose transport system permease protein